MIATQKPFNELSQKFPYGRQNLLVFHATNEAVAALSLTHEHLETPIDDDSILASEIRESIIALRKCLSWILWLAAVIWHRCRSIDPSDA